jgi:tetratricopeptide (TPR) repeat protein
MDELETALAADRRNTPVLIKLILLLEKEAQHARLASVLELQLLAAPTSPELWIRLSQAYADAGDATASQDAIERGLAKRAGLPLWLHLIEKLRAANDIDGLADTYVKAVTEQWHNIDIGQLMYPFLDFIDAHPNSVSHDTPETLYNRMRFQPHAGYSRFAEYYERWWKSQHPNRYFFVPRELQQQLLLVQRCSERLTAAWLATPRTYYIPPTPNGDTTHIQAWRRVFNLEMANHTKFSEDEQSNRMTHVWTEYVRQMFYYDSAWDEYAKWVLQTRGWQAAVAIYTSALQLRPDAALLHQQRAELYERAGAITHADECIRAWPPSVAAWCYALQFAARHKSKEEVRRLFLEASNTSGSAIYVCMADITLSRHREPEIAIKIYEKGMKFYAGELDYILQYTSVLRALGRHFETLAVFERAPPEALPHYLSYVRAACDTAKIAQLEQRSTFRPLHPLLLSAAETRALATPPPPTTKETPRKRATAPLEEQRPMDDVFAVRASARH